MAPFLAIGMICAALAIAISIALFNRKTPSKRKRSGKYARQNVPVRLVSSKNKLRDAGRSISGLAYVIDGDSIIIEKTEIRLFGIDAPELSHPYGRRAKSALIELCKGSRVRAEITSDDHFGRLVARCFLEDGRDVSAEMVKLGMALDWEKFSGGLYKEFEVPGVRRKLWLADARQKGQMHVWEQYEAHQKSGSRGK